MLIKFILFVKNNTNIGIYCLQIRALYCPLQYNNVALLIQNYSETSYLPLSHKNYSKTVHKTFANEAI